MRGRDASGVWRYRELVLPSASPSDVVTHPEGNTPLLESGAVATWAGFDRADHLLIKHEGHNPTGSFKDRGMTVAITQARRTGARAVACASTGNTSASLAAYAARAELPALVFVPTGKVASGKLAQTIAYGARTLFVRGSFDACLTLARTASAELGIQLLNSVNPFRIEGQKTIVFELLEQLGWNAPDWIALPAGNLGNTSAFGKALREAREVGLIDRVPRLCAVQADGAAPFARSFEREFVERVTRRTGDGGDGDSHRRSSVVESRRARDPRDERRRDVSDRRGNSRGEGGDRRRRHRLRTRQRRERRRRGEAAKIGRDHSRRTACAPCSRATCSRIRTPSWTITGRPIRAGPLANPPIEIEARVSEVARVLRFERRG